MGWGPGAASETDLFLKADNWKLHFIISLDGKVPKPVNDQYLKIWEVPRIP